MEGAKISQTRWPVELYEWMRERAHERRQSINRTVVELAERVREEAGPEHVQNILGRDLSCRTMPQGWEDQALQARQNRLGVPPPIGRPGCSWQTTPARHPRTSAPRPCPSWG